MDVLPLSEDSSGSGPQWSFSALSGHTRNAESQLALGDLSGARASLDSVRRVARQLGKDSPRWVLHARALESQLKYREGDPDTALKGIHDVLILRPKDLAVLSNRITPILVELEKSRKYQDEATWLRERISRSR